MSICGFELAEALKHVCINQKIIVKEQYFFLCVYSMHTFGMCQMTRVFYKMSTKTCVKYRGYTVSQTFQMLCHSWRSIACALMCPFIPPSAIISMYLSVYQLTASALSHSKLSEHSPCLSPFHIAVSTVMATHILQKCLLVASFKPYIYTKTLVWDSFSL